MKERKISRRAVCSAMVASLALGVLAVSYTHLRAHET